MEAAQTPRFNYNVVDITTMSRQEATKALLSVRRSLSLLNKAKGDSDGKVLNAIERKLTEQMGDQWDKDANKALKEIERSLKKKKSDKITEAELKRVDKIASKHLSSFGKQFKTLIEDSVAEAYDIGKKRFEKDNKKVLKALTPIDEEAIEKLSELYGVSADTLYAEAYSVPVNNAIRERVFEQGLRRVDAIPKIMSDVEKALGITGKNKMTGMKPPGWTGTARNYFKTNIQTTINRSRSFGSLTAMRTAEIRTYKIFNSAPESQICNDMNGRVFKVETAIKTMEAVLAAESPNDLKEITPFVGSLSKAGFDSSSTSVSTNTKIQEFGLSLPPYHGNCKTEIIVDVETL